MNPNKKNEEKIETEMNKIYRMIDEAEMRGMSENDRKRKTNIQIKKQNNIRTIESQLEKERCSFALNGKKTKSIAYLYDRNKNEYNIEKALKTLKNIKKVLIEKTNNESDTKMIKNMTEKQSKREEKEKTGTTETELEHLTLPCYNKECINYDDTNENDDAHRKDICKAYNEEEVENPNEEEYNEEEHLELLKLIQEYLVDNNTQDNNTQDNNQRYIGNSDEEGEDKRHADQLKIAKEHDENEHADLTDPEGGGKSPNSNLSNCLILGESGFTHLPNQNDKDKNENKNESTCGKKAEKPEKKTM